MKQLTPAQVASDPALAAQAQQNPGKRAYLCRQILSTVGPLVDPGEVVWDDGIDTIDPRDAARILALSLGIDAIDLGLSPRLKGGPNGRANVGIPVWMWAANPTTTTVGPISARRAWPGVVITGQARLTEVAWNMGDGTTVRCKGEAAKGTVYNTSYGVTDSPTCGHRYEKMSTGQPNNRYRVTATSYWVFEWQGGGMQGTIPLDVQDGTTLPVGELQVVVTSS